MCVCVRVKLIFQKLVIKHLVVLRGDRNEVFAFCVGVQEGRSDPSRCLTPSPSSSLTAKLEGQTAVVTETPHPHLCLCTAHFLCTTSTSPSFLSTTKSPSSLWVRYLFFSSLWGHETPHRSNMWGAVHLQDNSSKTLNLFSSERLLKVLNLVSRLQWS